MRSYEPFLTEYVGPEMELEIWLTGDATILVMYNESTFAAHDGNKKLWFLIGKSHWEKRGWKIDICHRFPD